MISSAEAHRLAGRAAGRGLSLAATTRQQLPQPQANHDSYSYSGERRGSGHSAHALELSPCSDGSQSQARGMKMSLNLPGSKSARNVAGKAGRAATKGATKMASAFKKLGRKGLPKAIHQEDPEIIGAVEESAELLDLDGIVDGVLESSYDLEGACEKTPGFQRSRMYSPQGTPSTDRPGSPERQEHSDLSSGGVGVESDPHGTSGSDSDAAVNSRVPMKETLRPARDMDLWDAQAHGKVRPLSCQSIWDIPTSRIPEPPPRPIAPEVSNAKARSLPQIKVSVDASAEPWSPKGVGAGRRCSQKHRIALLICLAVMLLSAAAVAAMNL